METTKEKQEGSVFTHCFQHLSIINWMKGEMVINFTFVPLNI